MLRQVSIMSDNPELREFLETEIKRVVEEAKGKTDDEAMLAGMVVGTLIKSGIALARTCGASQESITHACQVFLKEAYKPSHDGGS